MQVKTDYRQADISPEMIALLDACVKLNRKPATMNASEIEKLRAHGFSDEAIHDAFQVAAYFAYINRIADGLGVDLEPEMPPKPEGWDRG
ncbi:MAG: hypothetical protein Tsb009_22220 [Planctomycetaceae bacterium]